MTITVKHSKTNAISDWTQAQLDEQIDLGNFAPGTTLAQIVLPSDWNNDHTFTGTLDVANGGTGATTLTGYVKGSGTSALTASSTIPNTDISGLGTISTQNANNVSITGGSINGTTIGATTASTGKFTDLTDTSLTSGRVTYATTGGNLTDSANLTFDGTNLTSSVSGTFGSSTSSVTPLTVNSSAGANNTRGIAFNIASTSSPYARINVPQGSGGALGFFVSDGNYEPVEQMRVNRTASAVNYVQVTGGTTGNNAVISAQGSDSSLGLTYSAKNAGNHLFQAAGGTNFEVRYTATTPINFLSATGSLTTIAPVLSSRGGDTNISMAFQPKGTGAIDLAAGSSGVNLSNGGTVTAITRTATGSNYTSFPSVVISAPTTAGGVQATAQVQRLGAGSALSIVSGGTGYTLNDVLTLVGGTPASIAATYTVTGVSGGVITSVSALNFADYTALPTNPVSVTGGTGTGATLNIGWYVSFGQPVITNAGSGYIEQPTVTFSGGGGSGAAAYATVGSSVRLQSLGTTSEVAFAFRGASGINSPTAPDILRLLDTSALIDTGLTIQNSQFGRAQILAYGNANGNLFLGANGSGRITFTTNGTSIVEQMRVAHTASAVNYVQVTGGATGSGVTIIPQGSDANILLALNSKGTNPIQCFTNGSRQFQVSNTTSAANFLQVTGAIATASPVLSAQGSDTNIDLSLTPKGTGLVRFGTYTAGAPTATGYINIKAADGTTYKVLVST